MLPIRHSAIFRSRWIALLWAAGILWTVYEIVPTPEAAPDPGNATGTASGGESTADAVNSAEIRQLEQMVDNLTR